MNDEGNTPGDLLMAESIKTLSADVTYWRDRALRAESLVSRLKTMCYDAMRPIMAWEAESRTQDAVALHGTGRDA